MRSRTAGLLQYTVLAHRGKPRSRCVPGCTWRHSPALDERHSLPAPALPGADIPAPWPHGLRPTSDQWTKPAPIVAEPSHSHPFECRPTLTEYDFERLSLNPPYY